MSTGTPVFKPYYQNQLVALPPSLDELVPKGHPARVLDEIINKINILPLMLEYKLKGRSSYHPLMLLKVILFGYVNNIYSSRKLENACRENVNFMWLSGMSFPDHNTINRFRGVRLKDSLRAIFEEVVKLLAEENVLSLEDVYTDGTKIEANANKYTFVWKKSIQKSKERMEIALKEIWKYAQTVAKEEDDIADTPDLSNLNQEKVQTTVDKLNKVLAENPSVDKKIKAKLTYITKNYPNNIQKYEQQEEILKDRNSCSKTDKDATFMRMKDDHMKNGQLKPGYNIQISTSNQYIVNFTVHPNPTDTTTLPEHIEQHKESYGDYPKRVTADAGYGSEENYTFLENTGTDAFIKYGLFDKQQKKSNIDKVPFAVDKLYYNKEGDYFVCPMGQQMKCIGVFTQQTSTGFQQQLKKYKAQNCSGCPMRGVCHNSKDDRIIQVNENLNRQRDKAYKLLNSDVGIEKRKKRCHDVETVFGNIKQNHMFRRFMLRGKEKVSIEWGLLAIAQNIRKKAA